MQHLIIPELSLIKIGGEDAPSFLQGQLSNDVNECESTWQFSAYCNPKGRMLALFRLWQKEDDFYALVSSDILEAVCKRLRMYVLRSKVSIEAVSDAQIIAVSNTSNLPQLSKEALDQLDPDSRWVFSAASPDHSDNNHFVLNDAATDSYLMVSEQPFKEIGEYNKTDASWQQKCIQAGIPQINSLTSELLVPQMANLDLLDGINFKKGCYTGQEIVARMHYLGKLKQRLFLCRVIGNATEPSKPGDKLFGKALDGKNTGTLLSIDAEKNSALAVLRLAEIESEHYLQNGQHLLVEPSQPYPIPV